MVAKSFSPASEMPRRVYRLFTLFRAVLQRREFVIACIAVGLLLRIVWAFAYNVQPVNDSAWYYDAAVGIAQGDGFRWHGDPAVRDGDLTAHWPVGYPAVLGTLFALFGPSVGLAKALNIALAAAELLVVYWLTRRVFAQTAFAGTAFAETAAGLTLLLLALYPDRIFFTAVVVNEVLTGFLLLLGMLLLTFRSPRVNIAAAGLVFGLAVLTKTQVLLVPGIFLLTLVLTQRDLPWRTRLLHLVLRGVGVYFIAGLVLTPWLLRNYAVFDRFIFVNSSTGLNLYVGNGPFATGGHLNYDAMYLELGWWDLEELAFDDHAKRESLTFMRENPGFVLRLLPLKFWELYKSDSQGLETNRSSLDARGQLDSGAERVFEVLKVISNGYYYGLMAVGSLYLLWALVNRLRGQRAPVLWGVLGIAVYFTLTTLVFHGEQRYHYPYMPLLVLYAAAGLALLLGGRWIAREPIHAQVHQPAVELSV